MIIVGYQGIGKSTLAMRSKNYIDLESGNFWIDGKRDDNWYLIYCNIAEHLSRQGYTVFVSSHEVVRDRLKNSSEIVKCCVPDIELRDKWIRKLADRYKCSGLEKDYKALMNAKDRYVENITEIAESGFRIIWINNIDYDLKTILEEMD